jgi:hypothetical protein
VIKWLNVAALLSGGRTFSKRNKSPPSIGIDVGVFSMVKINGSWV